MVTRLRAARCRVADTRPGVAQDLSLFADEVGAAPASASVLAGPVG